MATSEPASDKEESKQFLVQCEDCTLEQTAIGRAEIEAIATVHQEDTGHALVAVEWPQ
ncbi:hypothetical protein ACFR9U_03270 [Halorientalis brevis]|uniref:Uncharacterized protein n=1 Tax=Halorientalis brevis TaxID=1126241 RepID=A0ABD6C703_9EURY|nr:hypothetical protein [Halorientalis brevis]